MTHITIAGKTYGPGRPLIAAELGTGHGGDLKKAAELVAAAAEAGAGCIKTQFVYADEILHPNTGAVPLPGGTINLYERFKALEQPPSFYAALKALAEERGLLFLCSPFGPRSARELRALGPACVKIASPELNYTRLLAELRGWGLPLILSSGVAALSDIDEAVRFLREGGADTPLCLLHCVTCYPAPETEYNLRCLKTLSGVFGIPCGLSDHSLDWELAPVLAAALGAAVIEKHFCLSRADPGLDDPIALAPADFARMTKAVSRAAALRPDDAISGLAARRGAALVEAVLGDGVKRLAPSERANYPRTRRSIHALRDIAAGETLREGMYASLRTEKVLRPGLPPSWEPLLAGRAARQDIPAGEGIRFEDI
ncbi:MAG: N-acetylneuraminate synthase family protein [Treponema sp.]|jgi:sialic acid synthase SpsE|nr:N-acetylneuraminate synthase family protein [Treponema sp.]